MDYLNQPRADDKKSEAHMVTPVSGPYKVSNNFAAVVAAKMPDVKLSKHVLYTLSRILGDKFFNEPKQQRFNHLGNMAMAHDFYHHFYHSLYRSEISLFLKMCMDHDIELLNKLAELDKFNQFLNVTKTPSTTAIVISAIPKIFNEPQEKKSLPPVKLFVDHFAALPLAEPERNEFLTAAKKILGDDFFQLRCSKRVRALFSESSQDRRRELDKVLKKYPVIAKKFLMICIDNKIRKIKKYTTTRLHYYFLTPEQQVKYNEIVNNFKPEHMAVSPTIILPTGSTRLLLGQGMSGDVVLFARNKGNGKQVLANAVLNIDHSCAPSHTCENGSNCISSERNIVVPAKAGTQCDFNRMR